MLELFAAHDMQQVSPRRPTMTAEDTFLECYCCGKTALCVIEIAGEDEPVHEESACELHARGHKRRGLLTPYAEEEIAPAP